MIVAINGLQLTIIIKVGRKTVSFPDQQRWWWWTINEWSVVLLQLMTITTCVQFTFYPHLPQVNGPFQILLKWFYCRLKKRMQWAYLCDTLKSAADEMRCINYWQTVRRENCKWRNGLDQTFNQSVQFRATNGQHRLLLHLPLWIVFSLCAPASAEMHSTFLCVHCLCLVMCQCTLSLLLVKSSLTWVRLFCSPK